MAKQTFTTGQVLTAAQLTNLQQTAMLGGAAITKTASYVLVAADAGSTVAMTSTSATTITVNSGLFAAGDTVFIQNLGSGNLTITAGTATVATAGSLILPQNDAGILYFTATGSAIFYDFIQVGAASPLTTKGDLYTFGSSDTRLGVGANGTTLIADSAETTGLKWGTPSSGLTLLSTASFTTASAVSLPTNTFSSTYRNYRLIVNFTCTSSNYFTLRLRASGTDDVNNNYSSTYAYFYYASNGISADDRAPGATSWSRMGYTETSGEHNGVYDIFQPQEAKQTNISGLYNRAGSGCSICFGIKDATTQFDSLSLIPGAGTITGTYSVFGYAK